MANIEKCSKNAEIFYSKIIQEVEKDGKVFGKIHEYQFNKKRNSCILWYQYGYDGVVASYVKNVYTNQTLLSYGQTNGEAWDVSLEDFTDRRKELFEQQ
jgi:alpha-galactosidase/6-phospho-beta-glucosidase family protein